jgi:hypothetical protein
MLFFEASPRAGNTSGRLVGARSGGVGGILLAARMMLSIRYSSCSPCLRNLRVGYPMQKPRCGCGLKVTKQYPDASLRCPGLSMLLLAGGRGRENWTVRIVCYSTDT